MYKRQALNRPRYFIAIRSVTIDRSRFPYRKPLHPDDAPWHVEDKHHLTFERLEDHDGPIEPVTPANIEVILEDEDEEKSTAPSLQTIDALEVHTRVMKRARSEGENEQDRVVGSAGSDEEQIQQRDEGSTSNTEEFQPQRTETETGVYFDEQVDSNESSGADNENPEQQNVSGSRANMAADFEHKGYAAVQRHRSYPSRMLHSALRPHNALAFIGFCMYMGVGVMCDTPMSQEFHANLYNTCLLYTSPSPRD